ncbi:MAG TPA: ABC transporter permease [Pyrinomonadaceae bacterium]|nr:ABC transporter permease [Pyrinomonadaceae bacterium]
MPLLSSIVSLGRNLFKKDRVEKDLSEEIQAHLDLMIELKIKEGLEPRDAQRQALVELGGIEQVKEQVRQGRLGRLIEDFWQDLRYALRTMRKSPVFAAVVVLSLGLGIGASATIFSIVDTLMLTVLPVQAPEQLYVLREDDGPAVPGYSSSYSLFERVRDHSQVFTGITTVGLVDRTDLTIIEPGGDADAGAVRVSLVSGNYFSVLSVNTVQGRSFTAEDDRLPGGHPVTVISYDFWKRKMAFAPDVVGRKLKLNDTTYTVLGVTPRGFSGDWVGRATDLWIPKMMQAQVMPEYPSLKTGGLLRIVARLKPGVTIPQAQAAVQLEYQEDLRALWPHPTPSQLHYMSRARTILTPAGHGYAPQLETLAQSLGILAIAVAALLIISCANVANLLLARSSSRRREMSVRLALGAGSARITRQLLTESLLLSTLGGALGILFTLWGTRALSTAMGAGPVQMDSRAQVSGWSFDFRPDWRMLLFTGTICLLTGVVFGFAPAFRRSKISLASALTKRGTDPAEAVGRFSFGKLLVISQVALSLLLLIGTGLFVRSLGNLKTNDLGFDRKHLLLVWTAPGRSGRQGSALANLIFAVQERVSSLPGVRAVGGSNRGLLEGGDTGGNSDMMSVEGQEPKPGLQIMRVAVTPHFFDAAGMSLLAGRDLTEQDSEGRPAVAIINQTMSRFWFGDQNPIGKRFRLGATEFTEIVGVVRDAKHGTPRDARGVLYVPYRQVIGMMRNSCLVVSANADPTTLSARVRQALRDVDPSLAVIRIDTVAEQLDDVLGQERLITWLVAFFGILAILLACIGLYGVISYTVARRTSEIGIRLALGATPAHVLRMVIKESLILVMAGIAVGVPITLFLTRLISSRLFGVSAADPLTIVATTLLIITVATLSAFLPANQASKVDPLVALRYE